MQLERFAIDDSLLEAAPARVTESQACVLLKQYYALGGELERLGGERDLNFRVKLADGSSRLFKLSHPLENPDVVDFHNGAMRRIEHRDPELPAQRVHASTSGEYKVEVEVEGQRMLARLLSFVDGQPLHRIASTSCTFRNNLGQAIARLDKALEGYNHPAASHILLWDMQHAEHLRPLLNHIEKGRQRDMVEKSLDMFERRVLPKVPGLRKQVIHNDMNPHNIIVDMQDPGILRNILDFGDMVYAPLINEVAVAAAYQLGLEGDILAPALDLIASYNDINPLEKEELEILPELLATRLALALCINSWRASLHPENLAYIMRNAQRAWKNLADLTAISPAQIQDRIYKACAQEVRG